MAALVLWVGYPASYTRGRTRPPQYVTLHHTAGSEGPTSAENGASYDKRRTDGTSCHYFVDSAGPALQEVPEGDRSHTAMFHGNEIGIHIELCGTLQTRAQWLDAKSLPTLKTAALLVADICRRQGFAVRRLSVAETRAAWFNPAGKRPTGINDHWTITRAYPEDRGDHTDVGPHFPWDVFLDLVTGDDVATPAQDKRDEAAAWRLEALQAGSPVVRGGPTKGEKMWVVSALQTQAASASALTAVAAGLAKAIAGIGTSTPETAAILADVQRQLDIQSALLAAEMRDTTAAALEGGAAAVHARHGPATS